MEANIDQKYPVALGRHDHHYWLPDRKIQIWDWWSWNYRVWGWWSWWHIYYHYYQHGMGGFMRQNARYHYRHCNWAMLPPSAYYAYHWHWCLGCKRFDLHNTRFFRVHFGGKKAGFNGLIYGAELQWYPGHYLEEYDHFYMYAANPAWEKHSQVVKNFFGKKGWAGYKGYQDIDFEDMPVSNRFSLNFNSIVFKQISRKQRFDMLDSDIGIIYGEINIQPSKTILNKETWEYFNTYGFPRNKRRLRTWYKYPMVRVFPGDKQKGGYQYAFSASACINLLNYKTVDKVGIELISGYYGQYPSMHGYKPHSFK